MLLYFFFIYINLSTITGNVMMVYEINQHYTEKTRSLFTKTVKKGNKEIIFLILLSTEWDGWLMYVMLEEGLCFNSTR